MRKLGFILLAFIGLGANAQITYPTEVIWNFENYLTSVGGIGIGEIAVPAFDVDIHANARVEIVGTGYGTAKTVFGARYANGTYASPTAVTSGQTLGEFGFGGYKATAFTNSSAAHIHAEATENWTDAATGAKMGFEVTPNGTTGTVLAMTIDQDRTILFESKIKEYANASITNGQLLIGNTSTSTFDAATLTAGQDITITNAGGSITVANTFNLDAGTYTPTVTGVTNIDAVSATDVFNYIRIGNVVTVSGFVDLDPTANGTTTFRVSLPIASDFTAPYGDCNGLAAAEASVTQRTFIVTGDTTNDDARVSGGINFTASQKCSIQFQYQIL